MRNPKCPVGLLVAAFACVGTVAFAAPSAQIQGMVSLGRNRPVVGAVVLVRSEADPGPIWVTASDQGGRFRIEELPDGPYRVVIRRDGLVPFEQTGLLLKAPFRGIVEAVLELAKGPLPEPDAVRAAAGGKMLHLAGTVLGPDGSSAVGATMRLVRDDGSLDPREVRRKPAPSRPRRRPETGNAARPSA